MLQLTGSHPRNCGLKLRPCHGMLLVPGKNPQTGIKKIYGKTSVRVRALIQNDLPGTSMVLDEGNGEGEG